MATRKLDVVVRAKVRDFKRKMRGVQGTVRSTGKTLKGFGSTMTKAVTAPLVGVGGAIAAATAKTAQLASQLKLASAQSGVAVEELQQIAGVANKVSGVEFDVVADGLKELALRSAEAAEGTGEAKEAFDRLGISQQFLAQASTAEVFARLRQETQGLSEQQRILAAEQTLGGEAGEKFAEVLGMSASEAAAMRKEMVRSGQVLSQEMVNKLDGAQSKMDVFGKRVTIAAAKLGTELIPVFEDIVDALTNVIDWFSGLSSTQKSVVKYGAAVAAAIGPISTAMGTVMTIAPKAAAAVKASAITMKGALITSGIGAIIVGIATGAWLVYQNWELVKTKMKSIILGIGNLFKKFYLAFLENVRQPLDDFGVYLANEFGPLLRKLGADDLADSLENGLGGAADRTRTRTESLRKSIDDTSRSIDALDKKAEGLDFKTGFEGEGGDFGGAGASGDVPAPGQNQNASAGGGGAKFQSSAIGAASVSAAALQTEIQLLDTKRVKLQQVNQVQRETSAIALAAGQRATALGKSLGGAFANVVTEGKNMGKALKKVFKDLVKQIIASIAKALILQAILAATGLGGGAGAAGGIGGALFGGAFGGAKTALSPQAAGAGMALSGGRKNMTVQVQGTLTGEGESLNATLGTTQRNQRRKGRKA